MTLSLFVYFTYILIDIIIYALGSTLWYSKIFWMVDWVIADPSLDIPSLCGVVPRVPILIKGRHGRHNHHLAWHGRFAMGHVNDTVQVMTPLGPQLQPGVHTQRVEEDDPCGHQGVSELSAGTIGVAVWMEHSLQRWGGPPSIVRAPPLVRHVACLSLDGIRWWSSFVRRNPYQDERGNPD
jgi:hypothetical protein